MREFIVEADGGSRGNPGPAGYGSVVIDAATGETLVEAAEYIGVATNNVAEYRGLLAGLRAARDLDPSAKVHVRMDSKLVVEQMSGRWKIKHPDMKPLATEAARVFPPEQVTYEWIPRERNKHADRLANEAMDAGKRGEQWSPSVSTAELDARAARLAAPEPSGPPGDAAAGAARARAALAEARPAADVSAVPSDRSGAVEDRGEAGSAGAKADADVRAARTVASPGWAPADMGAPATFVLLRHGETPLTPQKRFSGSGGTDPSLSDVGREQAERVGAALARRGTIEAIVASPLARTRETAGIVAARLGLEVSVDDGLRETDFGAWEGLTFGEVRERYPDDMNAWLADPEARPTGGGESFAATATRIAVARDKLVAAYKGRTVLLVTHVTPIKTFVRLALGAPPESLFRMELSAASLSAVAYYTDGNASVRLFNDTSHLR
ncbi:bifunctional RNase H/acid phosphatase [Streptomyces sp. NBC_00461]|uniref:bifunctional RNase H/acid phosphatase n=1 Tax=unclassified Streptomyces TaxID=2593676 RepID=UPI0022578ABA|nr:MULTISPECIES: bifunctional RNase H/acid phosphatase [unclassified Streptomyces]MCX5057503.1 bifunctional RNase H/acid phosphatase [Streptomyces sp. NBC_00452]